MKRCPRVRCPQSTSKDMSISRSDKAAPRGGIGSGLLFRLADVIASSVVHRDLPRVTAATRRGQARRRQSFQGCRRDPRQHPHAPYWLIWEPKSPWHASVREYRTTAMCAPVLRGGAFYDAQPAERRPLGRHRVAEVDVLHRADLPSRTNRMIWPGMPSSSAETLASTGESGPLIAAGGASDGTSMSIVGHPQRQRPTTTALSACHRSS